jgi:hypothetical protein
MKDLSTPRPDGSAPTIRRLRLGFWLIQALWLAAAISLGTGQARAEPSGQQQAVAGHVADVGTTGIGLLLGAAEANPLGVLTLGMKVLAHEKIRNAPAVEQPRLWSAYGAMGWGATANNVCVIAAIASGGIAGVLCPMIGLATGLGVWSQGAAERDRATFAAICDQARTSNPELVCTYRET